MESLSEKIYIELEPPTEEDARSDQRRLLDGLKERYGEVELPLPLLRQLYPLCRKAEWHGMGHAGRSPAWSRETPLRGIMDWRQIWAVPA